MKAPLPSNENDRLAALLRYAILDTPHEAAFDRITALAARLFNVPISQVALVDEKRQWFKSSYGAGSICETDRDISFCAYAILNDSVMVVPDATADSRFEDNPFVTQPPGIRFYAGAPLSVSGAYNIGTLCVIDTVPRQFSTEEQQILADLAAIAADELELRSATRENRRLMTAISMLSSGVLVTDPGMPDNPIIFANPAFTAMTGYQPEEVIGRNCRFLQGPDTDPLLVKEAGDAVSKRRPFRGTLLNYRKDGLPFWNELTVSPVFDPEGNLMSFVGLQTDVTERRKLEELRDSLTHMIIHDLRNPLATIIGFLDILKRQTESKLDQEEIHWVEIAQKGAETLNDMVTMLLDVNRLEAGEMPLEIERCDLVELVKNLAQPTQALVGATRLILDIPPAPVIAPCDQSVIRRVVNNLIGNALKYTPQGGKVCVAVTGNHSDAQVSVTDDGPGIPKEYHGRIFEKFGQVDGDRKMHSTGLGLTFCKLAVQAHGGTISVRSEVGKGSTFSFKLPGAVF